MIFLLCLPAFAANYTVKAGGGGNYTTIQACATAMAAGDTCTVYAGTYNENVTVTAGTVGNYKTLTVNASDVVSVLSFTLNSHTKLIGNCPEKQGTVTTANCGFFIANPSSPGAAPCVSTSTSATDVYIVHNVMYACANGIGNSSSTSGAAIWIPATGSFIYVQGNSCSYPAATVSSPVYTGMCVDIGEPNTSGTSVVTNILIENNDFSHYTLGVKFSSQHSIFRNNSFHDQIESEGSSNQHTDIFFSEQLYNVQYNLIEGNYERNAVGANAKGVLAQGDTPCSGCTNLIVRFDTTSRIGSGVSSNYPTWNHIVQYNNTHVDLNMEGSTSGQDTDYNDGGLTNVALLNNLYYYTPPAAWSNWNSGSCGSSCNAGHNLYWCSTSGASCTTPWNHIYGGSGGNWFADAGNLNGNPQFANYVTAGSTANDYHLQSTSPARNAGTNLTTVNGTITASTSLVVTDATYFQDGYSIPGVQADCIAVTTITSHVCITAVNYGTNTLTLASPISATTGDKVWLYSKSDGVRVLTDTTAPDMGAYPYALANPTATSSQLANNLVAGCNANVNASYCGTASTSFSIDSSNNVTINVPNTFGSGAIVGVSGCTVATYLNGLIFDTTNSSTTSGAVVGKLVNTQGTAFTHAAVSTTAETNCYLQGQGWQPFFLSPFPAPGSANCASGNGSVGCATGAMQGTWAFDWDTPSAALNTPPQECLVVLTDINFGTGGHANQSFGPSTTGEANDANISWDDLSGGYFYTANNASAGANWIAHGHINNSQCNGYAGFVSDTATSASAWYLGQGLGNFGAFSRKPGNRPGTNQALRYDINATNPYAPTLESRVLTNASGTVTSGTPTTLYQINTCPGFGYLTITWPTGGALSSGFQMRPDSADNMVSFSLGSGPQGTGHQLIFAVSLTNGTCSTWDTLGFTGTGLYSPVVTSGHAGTGYLVNDVVTLTSGCTSNPTAKVTSVSSGAVTGLSVTTAGSGCALSQSNTTTGGTGTGLQVDIAGIGAPGSYGTSYATVATGSCPAGSTLTCSTETTSGVAAFGIHSGSMDQSGLHIYVSGYASTYGQPGGATCTSCNLAFWNPGTTTVFGSNQSIHSGHPGIGYGWSVSENSTGYAYWPYSDPNCTTPSDCSQISWWPSNWATNPGGFSGHTSWPDPNHNQLGPFLYSIATNNPGHSPGNPPGWVIPFMDSMVAIDPSGPGTRWFAHWYGNTNNTAEASSNFTGMYHIQACSPDGVFCIAGTDNNSGLTGNTGNGTSADTGSTPLTVMESVMIIPASGGGSSATPTNAILLVP